ncbi:hypothetical protein I302_106413 [Kwoniella bestiolae CBS 10118]|uniref:Uncharacterized protein n=1 Tax=Kwoniella bestiolae CBS 10118 TaxID=1296100 RepID=A0A1B9G1I0_9TREE|nr:hypothetical protein I302_06329 [Kwoniella bestiolae CBS 10118]OCF24868.1 hypothetical protein I302_06329 [Kwoniella bestiolae CBS 10118]
MTAPLTHVHTHFNPRQEESNIPARNNSTSAITPLHAVVAPTSNISSLDASTHGGQLTEANTASLFFHGISFISSPTLINIRSRQTPARTERILVLLWEAFLLAKADQERVSHALVEATCAIGAVKLAFSEAKNGAASPKHCLERSKMIMNSVFQLVNKESAGPIHDSERQEKVLALTQLMMLRDAYVGDPDWLNTYRFCAKYVAEQGGPANIIHAAQMSSSRPHIERFLAYLTVYETLGAFSTKEAPVLLSCPNSLWLEDLPCAQEIMHADFGFSLPTLFLIANLAGIVASGETSDCLESQSLFTSLDTTHLATISSTPSPVRIQFGDLLMRHSLICHLLLVVYSFHRSHARIQQAGSAILELLVEVTIWTGSMINLLHPLLMAGEVIPKEQRHILELILGTAREKADTADVDAIHAVIKECWHRRDNGTGEETVFDVIGCAPPTNIL